MKKGISLLLAGVWPYPLWLAGEILLVLKLEVRLAAKVVP